MICVVCASHLGLLCIPSWTVVHPILDGCASHLGRWPRKAWQSYFSASWVVPLSRRTHCNRLCPRWPPVTPTRCMFFRNPMCSHMCTSAPSLTDMPLHVCTSAPSLTDMQLHVCTSAPSLTDMQLHVCTSAPSLTDMQPHVCTRCRLKPNRHALYTRCRLKPDRQRPQEPEVAHADVALTLQLEYIEGVSRATVSHCCCSQPCSHCHALVTPSQCTVTFVWYILCTVAMGPPRQVFEETFIIEIADSLAIDKERIQAAIALAIFLIEFCTVLVNLGQASVRSGLRVELLLCALG